MASHLGLPDNFFSRPGVGDSTARPSTQPTVSPFQCDDDLAISNPTTLASETFDDPELLRAQLESQEHFAIEQSRDEYEQQQILTAMQQSMAEQPRSAAANTYGSPTTNVRDRLLAAALRATKPRVDLVNPETGERTTIENGGETQLRAFEAFESIRDDTVGARAFIQANRVHQVDPNEYDSQDLLGEFMDHTDHLRELRRRQQERQGD